MAACGPSCGGKLRERSGKTMHDGAAADICKNFLIKQ